MNKYEIHPIEGDIPYATMHGDFSIDGLMVILDEVYFGPLKERFCCEDKVRRHAQE